MELPHKLNKHVIRGFGYMSSARHNTVNFTNSIRHLEVSFRLIKY